jgi:hypothetical protein
MEKVKRRITNGPSKEDLGLSVTEGKVVDLTVEGLGVVKAIVRSLKSVFDPMGDGTGPYNHVAVESWIQSPNGKFLNDYDTQHMDFDYYLPTRQGSGNFWKGIDAEVENLYQQLDELEKQQEVDDAEDEEGCKECGAPPSYLCYGYCPDCEYDELQDYIADAMETEAGFQASRQ